MDKNNNGLSFSIDGRAVSEAELGAIVERSFAHIDDLTSKLSTVEDSVEAAVKDAKVLVGEKVNDYAGDKAAIQSLNPVERRRVWSLGIKVIDDEQSFTALKQMLLSTAEVLKDVAGAQYDADRILADVLKFQRDLATEIKFLYGLAAVNAHQCHWMAESISLRIKRAGQGDLNKAEIECLNNVLRDIETKREFFALNVVGETHKKALEEQRKKDVEHDSELERQRGKDDEHDRLIKELKERIMRLESERIPLRVKIIVMINLVMSLAALIMSIIR